MVNPEFTEGDDVVVTSGEHKGQWGRVLRYEEVFGKYFVQLPEISVTGYFAFEPNELFPLEDEDQATDGDAEEDYEEEGVDVPAFGMSSEDFVTHLDILLDRTLTKVGNVGPHDAFFGFQEFEGMTPDQILIALLDKLEEGMALFAQAHILISRIGVALHEVTREAK
jgi:hypothetical protein